MPALLIIVAAVIDNDIAILGKPRLDDVVRNSGRIQAVGHDGMRFLTLNDIRSSSVIRAVLNSDKLAFSDNLGGCGGCIVTTDSTAAGSSASSSCS